MLLWMMVGLHEWLACNSTKSITYQVDAAHVADNGPLHVVGDAQYESSLMRCALDHAFDVAVHTRAEVPQVFKLMIEVMVGP